MRDRDVSMAGQKPIEPKPMSDDLKADLVKALDLVMSWIDNWSPDFIEDDEWSSDEDFIRATLAAAKVAA